MLKLKYSKEENEHGLIKVNLNFDPATNLMVVLWNCIFSPNIKQTIQRKIKSLTEMEILLKAALARNIILKQLQ